MDPYQTSITKLTIENLAIEDKVEGSMIRLRGNNVQLEFQKNMIQQVEISTDTLQFDILLRDLVWRSITIK